MLTRKYNFDALKPYFCIEKLGFFRGIYNFYFFFLFGLNIDFGYSLESPKCGCSNVALSKT